jgi:hypothetical protein
MQNTTGVQNLTVLQNTTAPNSKLLKGYKPSLFDQFFCLSLPQIFTPLSLRVLLLIASLPPAITLCRYGNLPPDFVFVERKTHKESWKGEESVKERFTIAEEKMVAFIDGVCVCVYVCVVAGMSKQLVRA